MADPLSLLRNYHISNKEIVEKDNYVCFADSCWLKTCKTNYFIYSAARDAAGKSYYTIEALLYFLKNAEIQHPTYVKQAANLNIPVVQRPDRKDLLAYLRGEIQTSSSIDKSAPIELPKSYNQLMKELYPNGIPSSNTTSGDAGEEFGPTANKLRRLDDVEKIRQQFSARLDAPKMKIIRPDVETGNTESLLDMMSMERIAALKAKRLAKKRSMIVDADAEIESGPGFGAATSVLLEMDSDFTKNIQNVEVIMRDRLSILQSQTKNFAKSIFPIIAEIKSREESANKAANRNNSQLPSQQMNPSSQQYNRYDQERFSRKDNQVGFRIDTTGSYHQSFALKNFNNETPSGQKGATNAGSQNTPGSNSQQKLQKRVSRTPIIIIPATNTSMINIANAMTILQDFKFIDSKDCPNKNENEVLIQRKKNDSTTVPYRIVSNASKLAPDDWNRVVAVFVQGPTWQFKGWPWNGNPVEIFSKIKAFHLKFDEAKLDPNVAKWSVEVINLSRNKRHLDRANLLKFWSQLDSFIQKHKAMLVRY